MSSVGQPIIDPSVYHTPCNTVWLLQRGLQITPGQYEQLGLDILVRLRTLGIAGENFRAPAVKRKRDQAVKEMIASHTNLSSGIPREWKKSALTWLVGWVNNIQRRLLRQHSSKLRTRNSDEDTDDNQDTKLKWKKLKSISLFANQGIISRIQAGYLIRVYWTELQETVECSVAEVLKEEVNYSENLWKQLEFGKLLTMLGLLFFREINVEEYKIVWGAAEASLEGDVDFAAAMTAQWASDSTNAMFTIKTRQATPTPDVTGHGHSNTKQQSDQRKALLHDESSLGVKMDAISTTEQEKRTIPILKPRQPQQDLGPRTLQNRPFVSIDLTSGSEDSPLRVSKRTFSHTRADSERTRLLLDLEDLEVNGNSRLPTPPRRIRRVRPRIKEESDDDENVYALRAAVPASISQDLSDTSMEDRTNSTDASDYEPPAKTTTLNTTTPDPTPKAKGSSEDHPDIFVCQSLSSTEPARPRRTKDLFRTPFGAYRQPTSSRAKPQSSLIEISSQPPPYPPPSRPTNPSRPSRPKDLSSRTLTRNPRLPTVRQILESGSQTTSLSRPLPVTPLLPPTIPVPPLYARLPKSIPRHHGAHPRALAPAPAPTPAPGSVSARGPPQALAERRKCVEPFVEEALGRNIGRGEIGKGLSFEEFLRSGRGRGWGLSSEEFVRTEVSGKVCSSGFPAGRKWEGFGNG
ncbi:hypothetical protein MMC32_000065 [Xylographa parallela]|nr:hypothetical protein [Xylographa parallela]